MGAEGAVMGMGGTPGPFPCSPLCLIPGTPMMAWGSPEVPSAPHLIPGTPTAAWGSLEVPSAPRLTPGTPMVAWGGLQQCPVPLSHPWDPDNGLGVPSCALRSHLTPGTPVMAWGSLAVLFVPPQMLEQGGTTPARCPLPLGGGHSPPVPGWGNGVQSQPLRDPPAQGCTELCWGHRVGSDPPQG